MTEGQGNKNSWVTPGSGGLGRGKVAHGTRDSRPWSWKRKSVEPRNDGSAAYNKVISLG
jgi:hypothetical protein